VVFSSFVTASKRLHLGPLLPLIIAVEIVWRCPSYNALLEDVFSTTFCSKREVRLDDREPASDSGSIPLCHASEPDRGETRDRAS
jgi:hypothetical protein